MSDPDDAKTSWARSPEDASVAGRRAAKLLLLGGGAGLLAGGVQLGTAGPPRVLRSAGIRITQVAGGMMAPPPPPWIPGALGQVQLEGAQSMAPGEQFQLRAVGIGSNYCQTDVTVSASYRSLAPDVASVSSRGLVTALTEGTTTLVVTYSDPVAGVVHTASHALFVAPRLAPPSVSSIYLLPSGREQVPVGALQLIVQGYGGGSALDMTRQVTWTISPVGAATIDPATGVLRLLRPGSVAVTATMGNLTHTASYRVVGSGAGDTVIETEEVECVKPVGQ